MTVTQLSDARVSEIERFAVFMLYFLVIFDHFLAKKIFFSKNDSLIILLNVIGHR